MRLLVVEDERDLAEAIARGLRREGWAVDVARDGGSALEKAEISDYDLVLLDRQLPVVHGDDVCRELHERGTRARILMLTASGTIEDRVDGLDLGADDYLPKPFAFEELAARVRALLRRAGDSGEPVIERAGIALDPARHTVERNGRPVELTPKEFAVLEILLRADGRAISAEELLERAWDENADPFTNAVRVCVMTLRRRLGEPPVIETVVGAGYRI
jgi:DNA-binding response OmpR family regulator